MNVSYLLKSSSYRKFCLSSCSIMAAMFLFPTYAQAAEIDIWDTTDPNNWVFVDRIETIRSAQSGRDHYDFFSASAHPQCVALAPKRANIWMHENTNNSDDLTFGFVFNKE